MEGEVAIIIMTRTGDAGAKTDVCCGILERKKIMWWAPHRGALIGGRAWLVWILILIFLPQRVCACIDSQAAEKRLPSSWPSCAGNFSSLSNVGRVNRGTAGQNEGESHHRPRILYTLN